MLRATYVGTEHAVLLGHTAIVRRSREAHGHLGTRTVMAQFDDLHLPQHFTHGWWDFHPHDFVLARGEHDYMVEETVLSRFHLGLTRRWPSARSKAGWLSHALFQHCWVARRRGYEEEMDRLREVGRQARLDRDHEALVRQLSKHR